MTKTRIDAQVWFGNNQTSCAEKAYGQNLPALPEVQKNSYAIFENSDQFNPSKFFTPGWNGFDLTSKSSLTLEKLLSKIKKDVFKQFLSTKNFPKFMRMALFREFLYFADENAIRTEGLDDFTNFWEHLHTSDGQYLETIDKFLDGYCYKVAIIYILKLRLLTFLGIEAGLDYKDRNILNPNSFFSLIFQKGSTLDLNSHALKINQYSWYQPNQKYLKEIKEVASQFGQIGIEELLPLCTPNLGTTPLSNSISSQIFGQFLNLLLLEFPKWLEGDRKGYQGRNDRGEEENRIQVVNCKFEGDFLNSLSLSHFLAQEANQNIKWEEILCPEFENDDDCHKSFSKICLELHSLTFLTRLAVKQGVFPTKLITQVLCDRHKKHLKSASPQIALFQSMESSEQKKYDRVVLNLHEFPKNNPQFFLMSQIMKHENTLCDGGYLYVFSSKKLFVPSQSERLSTLLEAFRLEGSFNFDTLKSRGKLTPYLYVFSKKRSVVDSKIFLDKAMQMNCGEEFFTNKKQPCLSFRFNGELATFSKFSLFYTELKQFFTQKKPDCTPLYQNDLGDGFSFEFFQDAIVDGKLINSSSKDSNKITHPFFFGKLLKTCLPLDEFFFIEQIESEDGKSNWFDPTDLLGLPTRAEEKFPYVLIVDFRTSGMPQVDIIPSDTYQSKKDECGEALCSYFGMVPKKKEININIFREFFSSQIGEQVLGLSLTGNPSKLKSKLKQVLVPKFFSRSFHQNGEVPHDLDFFQSSSTQLLGMHPKSLERKFNENLQFLSLLKSQFPWELLGSLCIFKNSLGIALAKLSNSSYRSQVLFNNPIIIESLESIKKHPIFPNNKEVFIQINTNKSNDLKLPFTHATSIKSENGDNGLSIHSGEILLISIYSDIHILNFIKYILKAAKGYPSLSILQNLKVPASKDLAEVLERHSKLIETTAATLQSTGEIINQTIRDQITINS
ncbi:MAG: hypothetical protein HOE90_08430 [Bacteriovoracaceae bacterium]|nr:hypothetical protein [Bacteriovoracaceae bacterium]